MAAVGNRALRVSQAFAEHLAGAGPPPAEVRRLAEQAALDALGALSGPSGQPGAAGDARPIPASATVAPAEPFDPGAFDEAFDAAVENLRKLGARTLMKGALGAFSAFFVTLLDVRGTGGGETGAPAPNFPSVTYHKFGAEIFGKI